MYTFKPFVFMKHEPQSVERPKARSGHRIACDDKHLYSYGGFNPSIPDTDPDMINDQVWNTSKPLFKELWKFNLFTEKWKRLLGQNNMPDELASNAMIMRGDVLVVHGGTGVPFGQRCSNQVYVCNLDDEKMYIVPAVGELPEPQYGQAIISYKSHLYTVGGTTGYEYTCDVHRCNLKHAFWESLYICSGIGQNEPAGRYRHEVAFDGRYIYVLGGGTAAEAFGFSEIPAFDLETNTWIVVNTYGDSVDNTVPEPRRCHGSVQYTDKKTNVTSVVICGGYNGDRVFSDVWKLDLNVFQWTCLRECILPSPVYFHSAGLTTEGRMYIFGGIVKENNELDRTDAVHSVWLTIPTLAEMSWQAVIYYYPDLRHESRWELRCMGIPSKFAKRVDKVI